MSKIEAAKAATDTISENWNAARDQMQTLWVNGAGVLSEPSTVRGDILAAKRSLDAALAALDGVKEWPSSDDYGD